MLGGLVLAGGRAAGFWNPRPDCLWWQHYRRAGANALFSKFFVVDFLERGEGREKKRKRNINWLPLACLPTGDLDCTPGMYPDQESSWWPFGFVGQHPATEPHQSGLHSFLKPALPHFCWCLTSADASLLLVWGQAMWPNADSVWEVTTCKGVAREAACPLLKQSTTNSSHVKRLK